MGAPRMDNSKSSGVCGPFYGEKCISERADFMGGEDHAWMNVLVPIAKVKFRELPELFSSL